MGQEIQPQPPTPGLEDADPKTLCAVLLAVIEGLANNVLNGDVWYLGLCRAREICERSGIPPEVAQHVLEKVNQFRVTRKRRNPASSMWDKE